jgi:hypothetical protein
MVLTERIAAAMQTLNVTGFPFRIGVRGTPARE